MMNRKKKKELRQRQSTRQLMGILKITPHGIQTEAGERVFYLIRPDNLSVLSPEVIRSRIRSLTVLLSTQPALEILALDSRESFQRNKEYYQRRIEEENVPEVRELLEKDLAHLDTIQFSSASSREFVMAIPLNEKTDAGEGALRQLEKSICDHGIQVRLANEQGRQASSGDLLPAGPDHGILPELRRRGVCAWLRKKQRRKRKHQSRPRVQRIFWT